METVSDIYIYIYKGKEEEKKKKKKRNKINRREQAGGEKDRKRVFK